MFDADVIIVFTAEPKVWKNVKSEIPLYRRINPNLPSPEEVYHSFATRVIREGDPHDSRRKCVMQAHWVELCLQKNRLLSGPEKADWEIMCVLNIRSDI
jgi:hypothetical protein